MNIFKDKILETFSKDKKLTNLKISKIVGCCEGTVEKTLNKAGIVKKRGTTKDIELRNKIICLYKKDYSITEIVPIVGLCGVVISRILKESGMVVRRNKYDVDDTFFEKIDTEEKAYFLGFLFADGYNNVENNFVKLTLQADDIAILYKLKECIKSDAPIKERTEIIKGRNFYRASLQISNQKISKDLESLGCMQAKTFLIKFPSIDAKLWNHFIRGYYDGDGCIYEGQMKYGTKGKTTTQYKCTITSNRNFIKDLNNIFQIIFKRKYPICKHFTSPNIDYITIGGNKSARTFLDWIYKDATIYLTRKYDKYQKLVSHKIIDLRVPVFVYRRKDSSFIGEFNSCADAAKEFNLVPSTISAACKRDYLKGHSKYIFSNTEINFNLCRN